MLAKNFQQAEQNRSYEYEKQDSKKVIHKKSSINKAGLLFLSILVLGVCLLVLSRYVSITSIRSEISKLEKDIEELEKKKTNLQAKLEGIKSSDLIEEEAVIKLGMNYPDEDQIVYISTKKIENKESSIGDKVIDGLQSLVSNIQIFLRR